MKRVSLISFLLTFTITGSALALDYSLSSDGASVVRLTPQGTVAASSFDTGLLPSGWSSTTGSGGSLGVTSYDAGYFFGTGGGKIQALYTNNGSQGTGQGLEWVQVVSTNAPNNPTTPFLDNLGSTNSPYYPFTAQNRTSGLPANQLNFYDWSRQSPATVTAANPISWNASLYPVIKTGNTTFNVQDGINWGWTMKKATVGSDSGVFVNPAPATAVTSGVGSNYFKWGTGSPDAVLDQSSLLFVGGAFDTMPNTRFKLGTLTFHNGTILTGTGADTVDFKASIHFANVPEKDFDLTTKFTITNTPNLGIDPNADADIVSIGNYNYTFNVLEGATASVDIYAMLQFNTSGGVTGSASGAALFSDDRPFDPSPDGYKLTIVGLDNPGDGGFVAPAVPEPSTYLLFSCGIAGLLWMRRTARQKRG